MATTPYTRPAERFQLRGVSLRPGDALPPGKVVVAQNVRSYEDGTVQPRYGWVRRSDPALGGIVHTLLRLNDTTSGASVPALRVVGAGANLYAAAPGAAVYPLIDTGYSGDPLAGIVASPVRSPQPWLYVADRSRQRKINSSSLDVPIGIAQPSAPSTAPVLTLQAPGVTVISDLDAAADWTAVGAVAAAPTDVVAVNTTIAVIVYDAGNTGYASIAATAMTAIHVGQRVIIAGAETVLITDVLPAIASTTIAAIVYDAGTTGACTIQPTASLGTGQLDGPSADEYQRRYTPAWSRDAADQDSAPVPGAATAVTGPATGPARVRQIDFPLNCLVRINSGGGTDEYVRILSVAVGQDGIQSFRCVTTNTHAAGESLTGAACFRAATAATRSAGNTVVANVVQQVITPLTVEPVVAGIQDTTLPLNLSLVGGRATQPDDELLLSVKVDSLATVDEIRIYLDVDAATTDFLQNYYFAAWRANDILAAIHATNTGVPAAVQDARQNAVLQDQIDQPAAPPMDVDWAALGYDSPEEWGRYNYVAPASGAPTALAATSTQLAVGNNQWITLKVKIRDLIHVGTDLTRTLANVGGVEILLTLSGTTSAVTVQYDTAVIQGGYGPDVGDTGAPYIYAYRYRSSTTGAFSNLSPPSRGSVVPRRQRVTGTATASSDSQADLIDWFRLGGGLTRWTYVQTAAALDDGQLDPAIEGGEGPTECFQPWPTSDLPRSGTGTLAGTALVRTGGDVFNTSWAPGTAITVNGVTTTLYASPASASLLHVVANCGSGVGVAWSIREPLLLGQLLPSLWGGAVGEVIYLFGCGDPTDPGALHWTIGNNPDGTRDAYWLAVTSASEPLVAGCLWDRRAFVFSTEQLYALPQTFGAANLFASQQTACGKGLWARWALATAPEGIYFLAKDGIYLTAGGAAAVCITDDLAPLFPQDGVPGTTVRGIKPPDMTQPTRLRLAVVDDYLYFDYLTPDAQNRTLVYDRRSGAWIVDLSARTGVVCRASEPGPQVENQILGGVDGNVYQVDRTATADVDAAISWQVATPWPDGGDPRAVKQFGDAMLDVDMRGATQNLSVAPVINDATTTLPAVTFGGGTTGRRQETIDFSNGAGVLARNFGLVISGTSVSGDPGTPQLFLWEPAFLLKVEESDRRATDWDTAGYAGTKQVRGVVLRANTYGVDKVVEVQYDGGTVGATLTINTTSEQTVAFAFTPFYARLLRLAPTTAVPWLCFQSDITWTADPKPELTALWTDWTEAGRTGLKFLQGVVIHADTGGAEQSVRVLYDNGVLGDVLTLPATTGEAGIARSFATPFLAHVVRLVPQGPLRILNVEWIWEPAPEFGRQWTTQPTTHDLPGYFTVVDAVIAYNAPATVRLAVQYDQGTVLTYDLPAGANYQRVHQWIAAGKGRSVVYGLSSAEPFQVYQRDCSVRVQGWGQPGGYLQTRPFGGPSRAVGAEI